MSQGTILNSWPLNQPKQCCACSHACCVVSVVESNFHLRFHRTEKHSYNNRVLHVLFYVRVFIRSFKPGTLGTFHSCGCCLVSGKRHFEEHPGSHAPVKSADDKPPGRWFRTPNFADRRHVISVECNSLDHGDPSNIRFYPCQLLIGIKHRRLHFTWHSLAPRS